MLICQHTTCSCIWHELLKSLKIGDNHRAKLIIDNFKLGNVYEAADDLGKTLLHYVTSFQNIEMMKLIIGVVKNINVVDRSKETPLMLAARLRKVEAFKLLLESGANIVMEDIYDMDVVEILCSQCIDEVKGIPNSDRDYTGVNATRVMLEILFKKINLKHPLLKKLFSHKSDSVQSIVLAFCDEDVMDFALAGYYGVNGKEMPKGKTALDFALLYAQFDRAEKLIGLGAHVDRTNRHEYPALLFYNVLYHAHDKDSRLFDILYQISSEESWNIWISRGFHQLFLDSGCKTIVERTLNLSIKHTSSWTDYLVVCALAKNPNLDVFQMIWGSPFIDKWQCKHEDIFSNRRVLAEAVKCPEKIKYLLEKGKENKWNFEEGKSALLPFINFTATEVKLDIQAAQVTEIILLHGYNDVESIFHAKKLFVNNKLSFAARLIIAHMRLIEFRGKNNFSPRTLEKIQINDEIRDYYNLCGSILADMEEILVSKYISLYELMDFRRNKMLSMVGREISRMAHEELHELEVRKDKGLKLLKHALEPYYLHKLNQEYRVHLLEVEKEKEKL